MEITICKEVTPDVVEAFERLTPMLSSTASPPGEAFLRALVGSDASILFLARLPEKDGKIVGSLTLAVFRVPTGVRAWIEDVVVDTAERGQGIGEALTRAALDEARRLGTKTVDLTSRPSREAANRLYQRIGFQLRQSNLYRYDLEKR